MFIPPLPVGSARNKIEFLYDLLLNYSGGKPDVGASFNTVSYHLGAELPDIFRVNVDMFFFSEHYNTQMYLDNDGHLNFYQAVRSMEDYGVMLGDDFDALGFGVTLYSHFKLKIQGDTLAHIETMLSSDGVDYAGQMLVHMALGFGEAGDQSFTQNIDTQTAYFYKDGDIGYLVIHAPYRFNVILDKTDDRTQDDYKAGLTLKLYSQTSGSDAIYLNGDDVEIRTAEINVHVSDYWLADSFFGDGGEIGEGGQLFTPE